MTDLMRTFLVTYVDNLEISRIELAKPAKLFTRAELSEWLQEMADASGYDLEAKLDEKFGKTYV